MALFRPWLDSSSTVIEEAKVKAAGKVPAEVLERLRLESFAEGRAVQVLHVGPYSVEGPTIAALHAFITDQGAQLTGKHHEIYLGDPARSAPDKLTTILRQPIH